MACNICGSDKFEDYRGRPAERCGGCGAKARHRVALAVYEKHLFSQPQLCAGKVLHLAPERYFHDRILAAVGAGYMPSDMAPERYPHAQCLKLGFPDGFDIFPPGYFSAILHNHVLEHLPGSYRDHLVAFAELLSPGGRMIFSVPGPYMDRKTEEGGEHLATDAERLEKFLQEDHYKMLGVDFVEFLRSMGGGTVLDSGIDDTLRKHLNVRPGKAPFFIWQKDTKNG